MKTLNKPFTSHTKNSETKSERTIIKNATSNIFFNNQTHHKHTDDFKENYIGQSLQEDMKSFNKPVEMNNTNNFILGSYDIKTPSQINLNSVSFYGDNVINLEEIKIIQSNLFEFVSFLYSKTLSFLISPKNTVDQIRKASSLDKTAQNVSNFNSNKTKETKSEELLNLLKHRIDLLINFNFQQIENCFKNKELKKEINDENSNNSNLDKKTRCFKPKFEDIKDDSHRIKSKK